MGKRIIIIIIIKRRVIAIKRRVIAINKEREIIMEEE
jgi:hypothetical protein